MAYDGYLTFDTQINTSGFQNDANKLSSIVKGLGVFKLFEKGMQMITDSLDSAMGRIDTMEQFDRVMSTMTGSVSKTNRALETTKDIVTDTAYGLDVAAKSVQNFVSRGMEVSNATETVEAWGNAVAFYGDGSNESFSSVTEALSKMQTKGTVTMEHMEMLLNAGIPAIDIYADAMSTSSDKITDAMSKGETSADSFIYAMNEALESGTTKFPSVANAAKEAGASWSGTFDNMKAAVTRGTQSIITAIDDTLEELGKPSMRETISSFGKTFESVLKDVADAIPDIIKNIDLIIAGILTLKATSIAWNAVKILNTASTKAAKKAYDEYNKALKESTAETQKGAIADAFHTSGITTKQIAVMALSGQITIAKAIQMSWNKVIAANPFGMMAAAIALVIGGVVTLALAMKDATEANIQNSTTAKAVTGVYDDLADSIDDVNESHKESIEALDAEYDETMSYVKQLDRLIKKEDKTAAEKKKIAEITDELNGHVEGLNLTYDEESDCLNSATGEIEKYIKAASNQEKALQIDETKADLIEKRIELTESLKEVQEEIARVEKGIAEGTIDAWSSEYQNLEQLHEKESMILDEKKNLRDDINQLNKDSALLNKEYSNEVVEAWNNEAETLQETTELEEELLEQKQEAYEEYYGAACDMFKKIADESEASVDEMIENLQYNQEAVANWANNLVELADKGINEGFLQYLKELGPESAATIQAIVDATPEQFAQLDEAFANGAYTAADAVEKAFAASGVEMSGSDIVSEMAVEVDNNDSIEKSVTQTIVDTKTSAVEQVRASNFNSIGQMIVWGIVDGLSQNAYSIYNKIRAICKQAYKAAKDENEINSPSKLYRRGIGLGTMEGWAYGVEDGEDDVLDAYLRTSERIRNAVQSNAKISTGGFVDRLRSAVAENNMLFTFSAVPAYSAASVQGGYTTNLYQTVNTHDSLSPAELTREAEDFLTRSKWRLP